VGFGGYDVAKSAPLVRNGNDIARTMQNFLDNAAQRRGQAGQSGTTLARDPRWMSAEFGPLNPLNPEFLDETGQRPDGQPEPRLYEYPMAWNLTVGKERWVQWDMLRRSSEMPIFRACIELRKTELSSMDWGIRVNPKVAARIAISSGKNPDQVSSELRKKHQDEIDRLEQFWQWPDRKNGRNFGEWIGLACDEQLTHDALAIYPWQTYGGDLLGLWILDGSSIMPLLDQTGGRPSSPLAAYQQVLYGFPRGEFTAQTYVDADGNQITPGGLTQGQLVYKRRTPRVRTPYGYSATEQALLDGLLYNKRFGWLTSEYTEGTVGAHYMTSDAILDWTPEQLLDYERQFNMRMAGMTAERMLAHFLPPGVEPKFGQNFAEKYKPDFDLHLIKLVAMHFGSTATELGFPESGGLGSSGFHEGQEDINFRRGRIPDLRWFSDLCTEISLSFMKMDSDLEFYFLGLDSEDEAAADAIDKDRVAGGRMTLNEARARVSQAPYPFPEADKPMLQTERGVVFLEGSSKLAPAGVLIEPPRDPAEQQAQPGGKMQGTKPSPAAARRNAAKDAELVAYRSFLAKGERKRPFRFEQWGEIELEDLAWLPEGTYEVAKAGGTGPKVPGPVKNWSLYTGLE
jgi:hypothetical protein